MSYRGGFASRAGGKGKARGKFTDEEPAGKGTRRTAGSPSEEPALKSGAADGPHQEAAGFAATGASTPQGFKTPPRSESGRGSQAPSGGAWSSGSSAAGGSGGFSGKKSKADETLSDLQPQQRCNRQSCDGLLERVTKTNKSGDPYSFGRCKNKCGGGGVVLSFSKKCYFCFRAIAADSVSLSWKRGDKDYVNAHTWNCLSDTKPDSTDSAVAVQASRADVGKVCYDCFEENTTIGEDSIIVDNAQGYHFQCAVKARKIYIGTIEQIQDDLAKHKDTPSESSSKRKAVSAAEVIDLISNS